MLMILGLWSVPGVPKDTAMILRAGTLRPRLENQWLRWVGVRRCGWMQWATIVRMRRALWGPILVRKEAL
jgi:hypothetical protein